MKFEKGQNIAQLLRNNGLRISEDKDWIIGDIDSLLQAGNNELLRIHQEKDKHHLYPLFILQLNNQDNKIISVYEYHGKRILLEENVVMLYGHETIDIIFIEKGKVIRESTR